MNVFLKYFFTPTILKIVICFLKFAAFVTSSRCDNQLGMESGLIPDSSLTSSSYFNQKVGPQYSRIRTNKKGGAWCPAVMINSKAYEWLQVDLGKLHLVTAVETQGRYGDGKGVEYVAAYRVEYRRSEEMQWNIYQDTNGSQMFQGNTNSHEPHKNTLDHSFTARWIRVVPYSLFDQTVCLRLELYGCPWQDGLMVYDCTLGDFLTPEFHLRDVTYDGDVTEHRTNGGLGLLNDGDEGDEGFNIKSPGPPRHTGWLGWRNTVLRASCQRVPCPVQLNLTFDVLRSFQEITFTCLCAEDEEASTFDEIFLWFAFEEDHTSRLPVAYNSSSFHVSHKFTNEEPSHYFKESPIFSSPASTSSPVSLSSSPAISSPLQGSSPDSEAPHSVSNENFTSSSPSSSSSSYPCRVRLQTDNLLARHVKMEMYFSSAWLVISEIRFTSTPQDGVFKLRKQSSSYSVVQQRPHKKQSSRERERSGLAVGYHHGEQEPAHHHGSILDNSTHSNLSSLSAQPSSRNDSQVPFYGRTLTAVAVASIFAASAIIAAAVIFRWRKKERRALRKKSEREENSLKSVVGQADDDMIIVEEDKIMLQIGKSNGNEFVYFNSKNLQKHDSDLKSTSHQEFNSLQYKTSSKRCSNSTYQLYNPTFSPFEPNFQQMSASNASLSHFGSKYCTNGHSSVHRPSGISYNRGTINDLRTSANDGQSGTISDIKYIMEDVKILSADLKEFPSKSFEPLERIGLADFGSIELCSLVPDGENLSRDARTYPPSASMAVVLHLNSGTKIKNRLKFLRQLKTLLQLRDSNILTVTGLCHRSGNNLFSVVMETVTWRDMHQFLLESTSEPGRMGFEQQEDGCYNALSIRRSELRFMSLGCLTHLACQVASGMKYLEKCGLVHGDLSARNCLVGPRRLVKICDLARWRTRYRADYYSPHPQSPPLPVRWMAWEAIHLDELSIKSDVWSFGILMWEIMNLSRERPYSNLTDTQVIDNSLLQRGGTSPGTVYPLKPLKCPPETYDLMTTCWRPNPMERPNFKEINTFLNHKIAGYDPHR